MTPPAIQLCTACRECGAPPPHPATCQPCGEPVAELGPCVYVDPDMPPDWVCKLRERHPLHEDCPDGPGSECDTDYHHTYKPGWGHVTLGPCETCGHEDHTDDSCSACLTLIFDKQDKPENLAHDFTPTVTARTGLGHEAEVSDGS